MSSDDATCQIPDKNATPDEIREILLSSRVIAVVGLSPNPARPSHGVAAYLQSHGFTIIPVNPSVSELLGEKSYPDLASIPRAIDIVDIFRRSEALASVVDAAIAVRARAVWMQQGLVDNAAAARARAAGLSVVMNKCIMVEHRRLQISPRV
jgi:predicted CoA-binding protein